MLNITNTRNDFFIGNRWVCSRSCTCWIYHVRHKVCTKDLITSHISYLNFIITLSFIYNGKGCSLITRELNAWRHTDRIYTLIELNCKIYQFLTFTYFISVKNKIHHRTKIVINAIGSVASAAGKVGGVFIS
jgi:hypothetical protein